MSEEQRLREVLEICLGHMTGGMDGNWAGCDPVEVARLALSDKPETTEPAAMPEPEGEAEFAVGSRIEKYTGEAIWHGIVAASYLTTKGKRRYVVEVEPQGFQMIAVPTQLRAAPFKSIHAGEGDFELTSASLVARGPSNPVASSEVGE